MSTTETSKSKVVTSEQTIPKAQPCSPGIAPGFVLAGQSSWQVQDPLGSGGFGAVFVATELMSRAEARPPRRAAVKVFEAPDGLDPERLLKRELAALLALDSKHIPKVYDWSVADQRCFVVMELFDKGSLIDVYGRSAPLKIALAWRLLLNLLEALVVAHQASLLHLDVKPSNVLVAEQGHFVLTDFGVAQSSFSAATTGITARGTAGYQAPEQIESQGAEVDVRSDLFSVGATVWSRITGIDLKERPNLLRLQPSNQARYVLQPPSHYNSKCPQNLDRAVMNLLLLDPVDRPGGAAEALTLTRRMLSGHSAGSALPTDARGLVAQEQAKLVTSSLIDPLWISIAGGQEAWQFLAHFPKGRFLCREAERSHHAFALLRGSVSIERGGQQLFVESREGTFLGEVSTLTGANRTAAMRALDDVWVLMFNAAELEQFVTANPALGMRMIKTLADRLARESKRS